HVAIHPHLICSIACCNHVLLSHEDHRTDVSGRNDLTAKLTANRVDNHGRYSGSFVISNARSSVCNFERRSGLSPHESHKTFFRGPSSSSLSRDAFDDPHVAQADSHALTSNGN